ncbi:histidine kinase [Solirubrobacter phytolaccae]|uniref:histidine kinase n=1 Tax=Solirubrobacter phytolaccae TaxID=1404360 RepID=A0A9X3SF08_9ACTN|nr:histidine kinase [Solirubrobacter phytolaccae]MDA0180947.1 histidine kinase [Solirubrobacter phytolaccae]
MSRQMLPGALLQEPGSKRTARDWLVDVLMTLIALTVGVLVYTESEQAHSDFEDLIDLTLGVTSLIALWWRRRWPGAIGILITAASAFSAFSAGAALIALFNVALRGTRRQIITVTAVGIAGGIVYTVMYPTEDDVPLAIELAFAVLITLVVVPWGLFTRTQRDLVHTERDRAKKAEAEQLAHVEAAREAERRRIAGEMHDVLAHRLSLLSVHAGALEFRPDATPAEISEAAGVIRATATEALRDLRDVIGVLRTSDGVTAPPQPTLDAIPALVEESRAAGMHVRARIEASGGEVMVGRTAYRVVQEGLTNARKHAPAAAVEVTVGPSDASLVVEVVSRKSALAPEAGPGGSGLIGLTERVALAGGSLEHGPNRRGDFVLRAVLPWT